MNVLVYSYSSYPKINFLLLYIEYLLPQVKCIQIHLSFDLEG